MDNHYCKILGLEKGASQEDIKKAYKKYAAKFHPDKHGGDDFFKERFQEIQEAYEYLKKSNTNEQTNLYYQKADIVNPATSKTGCDGHGHRTKTTKIEEEKDNDKNIPIILSFKSSLNTNTFTKRITVFFSWETSNADDVLLHINELRKNPTVIYQRSGLRTKGSVKVTIAPYYSIRIFLGVKNHKYKNKRRQSITIHYTGRKLIFQRIRAKLLGTKTIVNII